MAAYRVLEGRIQAEACEINVVHHCNLSCRSCSHVSPIMRRQVADPDVVYRDLAALAPHYRPRHVRLLGGEPLLHPALVDIMAAVRHSAVSDRIRMITNGVYLSRMTPAAWEGIDELHVSLYPGYHIEPAERQYWKAVAAEHGVEVCWKQFDYFRQSYSEAGTADAELVRRIFNTCQIAHVWRCHNVIDGYFYKCPQSYFLSRLLSAEERPERDGLAVSDRPSLGGELLAFLEDKTPLASCRNCLGSVGRRFAHEQVRRPQFRAVQAQRSEELVDYDFLDRLLKDDAGASNGCVTFREHGG